MLNIRNRKQKAEEKEEDNYCYKARASLTKKVNKLN